LPWKINSLASKLASLRNAKKSGETMSKLRTPYGYTSQLLRMNEEPMHSPGCVDEIRQLKEFLQKRFPDLHACFEFDGAGDNGPYEPAAN